MITNFRVMPADADRPILFSPKLVRAIESGHKTETRRLVTDATTTRYPNGLNEAGSTIWGTRCRIQQGDLLWVRETWGITADFASTYVHQSSDGWMEAEDKGRAGLEGGKWRPSIFMPRQACKLTLRVTSVWQEALHDLTPEGALAEGVKPCDDPVAAFAKLWDSINRKRCPWQSNPAVWVIRFKPAWFGPWSMECER